MERSDAVKAAARGRLLEVFDAQDGPVADGQRTCRTRLVHTTRVTKGQAGEYKAIQALARDHAPLLAGLREGYVLTKSVALQLARWTRPIPEEYRAEAEEILVAAASVSTGDGGAWLDGDAAREVACDAMIIPVVTGDIDPRAVDELIALCVQYHGLRTQAAPADHDATSPVGTPGPEAAPETQDRTASQDAPDASAALPAGLAGTAARHAEQAAAVAAALAEMEHQILGKILQVVSGPGGAASFLRRHLLGKPLAGPSLPLDVGQP